MTLDRSATLEFEELDRCPVCGSGDLALSILNRYADYLCTYSRCQACGLDFLNPRMTDEQTARYYQGEYRSLLYGEGGVSEKDIRTQARRASMQAMIARKYVTGVQSHLEIGCSAGYLLAAVKAPRSVGVEPDERYHRIDPARRYTMHRDITDVPPEKFDLISMSHVFEHINHPVEYLTALMRGYARTGTRLLVEVPNAADNIEAYIIHHPVAYNLTTLRGVMRRAGCVLVEAWLHGLGTPAKAFLLTVFEYEGEINVKTKDS